MEAFKREARVLSGRQARCKLCDRAYDLANASKIRERRRRYYAAHRETILRKAAAYRCLPKSKERRRQYAQQYYATGREYHLWQGHQNRILRGGI